MGLQSVRSTTAAVTHRWWATFASETNVRIGNIKSDGNMKQIEVLSIIDGATGAYKVARVVALGQLDPEDALRAAYL
ncbi:unnamed protein product, partial [Iphiclides podalirius]